MPYVAPLPDTDELLRWLKSRAVLEESLFTRDALTQAVDTIERLQKENDRLRRPRCSGLRPEEIGDPCKFCGAREATDVCRDGTYHIIRERDAALAEVKRLKARVEKQALLLGSIYPLHR